MEKDKIIYKLKSLEKNIIRIIIKEIIENKGYDKANCPTPTQMQIISHIINNSNDVYQKDLEKVLNLRRATVSGVLQTMEKNGLIDRIISNNDARSRKIVLKEKAIIIYQENKERLNNIENIIKKGISNNDLNIFIKVIDKMKDNLNDYQDKEEKFNDKIA